MNLPFDARTGPSPIDAEAKGKLFRWQEQKNLNSAVAVYGTSTEVARQIARTGIIPSTPSHEALPYKKRLMKGGNHLYYFFPLIDHLKTENPSLYKTFQNRFGNNQILMDQNISENSVVSSAQGYAFEKSVGTYFTKKTQIPTNESTVFALAFQLMPDRFETLNQKLIKENKFTLQIEKDCMFDCADPNLVAKLKDTIPKENLKEIISESFERRGILIYFNSEILTGRVLRTYEDEAELIIVAPQPFRANSIVAIESLSEVDKMDLTA